MNKLNYNRHLLLIVAFLLVAANVYSQDYITLKDNTKKAVVILEVNPDNVKYKDFENQTGPTYTLLKADIKSLLFQNGKAEIISTNPVLERDGNRVYLDGKKISRKELENLFQGTNALPIYKNSETTKILSYVFMVPGAIGVGLGLEELLSTGNNRLLDSSDAVFCLIGGGVLSCSAICFSIISQNGLKKSIEIYNKQAKREKLMSLNIGVINNKVGIRLDF